MSFYQVWKSIHHFEPEPEPSMFEFRKFLDSCPEPKSPPSSLQAFTHRQLWGNTSNSDPINSIGPSLLSPSQLSFLEDADKILWKVLTILDSSVLFSLIKTTIYNYLLLYSQTLTLDIYFPSCLGVKKAVYRNPDIQLNCHYSQILNCHHNISIWTLTRDLVDKFLVSCRGRNILRFSQANIL